MPVPSPFPAGTTAGGASRRRFIGVAASMPWIAGCTTPLPLREPAAAPARASAAALLAQSAEAHGLAAYRELHDVNVRYEGQWRPFIDRLQPVLVDKAYRGASEERLIPAAGVVAQAYTGSAGRKHVVWRRIPGTPAVEGEVAVWLNRAASADDAVRSAAALVADAYGLFLLGPLWLLGRGSDSRHAGSERVDGRSCDVVELWLRPGLGRSAADRVAVAIDSNGWMRRVRFTLEGFAGTRGAVAQVDVFEHERRFGVVWPMRSHEEVVHPLRIAAHDWRITGLDVNRHYDTASLTGPSFGGVAAPPATPI